MTTILCYLDTFAGLVPAKVLQISSDEQIIVQVTADRPGMYNRGQQFRVPFSRAIPRKSVYRSRQACGQYRIRPYSWLAIAADAGVPIADIFPGLYYEHTMHGLREKAKR